MFSRAYICPTAGPLALRRSSLSPRRADRSHTQKHKEKPMRQITEKAIAFVMAIAISTGAFNVLIV